MLAAVPRLLVLLRSLLLILLGLYGWYGTGVEIVVGTGIVVLVSTGIVVGAGGTHGVIQNDLIQFAAHLDQGDGDQNVKGNGQQVGQEGQEREHDQIYNQTDHAETDHDEVDHNNEQGDLSACNDAVSSLFDHADGAHQLGVVNDGQNTEKDQEHKNYN